MESFWKEESGPNFRYHPGFHGDEEIRHKSPSRQLLCGLRYEPSTSQIKSEVVTTEL